VLVERPGRSRPAGPFDFPLGSARGFGKTGQARETPVPPPFLPFEQLELQLHKIYIPRGSDESHLATLRQVMLQQQKGPLGPGMQRAFLRLQARALEAQEHAPDHQKYNKDQR
jgi:hypothetical protein